MNRKGKNQMRINLRIGTRYEEGKSNNNIERLRN
jgi:hypothetical protein